MTRDEQLNLIRSKCIAANPDKGWVVAGLEGFNYWKNKPLPVRLADVLLAVNYDHLAPLAEERRERVKDLTVAEIVSRWNLRQDDLTEQSDECILFLSNLLK